MKVKKIIKRTVVWTLLVFILLISTGIILSISYKEEIIAYFLHETNKHIKTPVDVGQIDVSIFNHFPNVSINLTDVTIKESTKKNKGVLAKMKLVSASFNPFDLINKNYSIDGLHIYDGEINLEIDQSGNPNYLFYKRDSTSKGARLSLKKITCEKVKISFCDLKSDYNVILHAKKAESQLSQRDKMLNLSVDGNLVSDEIRVKERNFFNNKVIDLETSIEFDLQNKIYRFKSGGLRIDRGEFQVTGSIDIVKKHLALNITGVNTTFQSVNSLLSSDLSDYFKNYKSKGSVYFSGKVHGGYGNTSRPRVDLEFGAKNASFFHPKYKKQIKEVHLRGQFTTGETGTPENYRLDLKNFSCKIENELLEGSLALQNFIDYRIDLILKGEANVNTLLTMFPGKYIKTAFGVLNMDVHVNGNLKNPKPMIPLNVNGEIELRNISFVLNGEKLPFNRINGSLMLRKNDLAISDLNGSVGNSDFRLNGFIKDVSNIVLQKNRVYKIQADLLAKHIDFDELLKSNFASRDTVSNNTTYEFRISPKIDLDFNCEVDHLKFKRFNGRNIKGQVRAHNQIAVLKNISFSSMGGAIHISGSVNTKTENLVETISEANLYNINIDSVFYVFKNFNQEWLIDKNLKGQLDADLNLYMNFNKNLILNSKSLTADIHTAINNGELNDFEPMMKLSKFVEEESLAKMRFSRMTNEIKIENRTIYLPEMEIRSNVSNILVKGTHTFDRDIDYHLRVPLKSFIRISRKKNYDQSARQGMSLLLKITGSTSDYKISYDTKALRENLTKDFLDEGQEWKNIRKKNASMEDEIPELEEEYFDFEEAEDDPAHK